MPKHKQLSLTCKLCGDARWASRERLDKRRGTRYSVRSCLTCPRLRTLAKTHALKELAFDKHGRVCNRCGYTDIRALQFDHIYGGGGIDRGEKTSYTYYRTILNTAPFTKYQVLCANCNQIKKETNNEVGQRLSSRAELEANGYYARCYALTRAGQSITRGDALLPGIEAAIL